MKALHCGYAKAELVTELLETASQAGGDGPEILKRGPEPESLGKQDAPSTFEQADRLMRIAAMQRSCGCIAGQRGEASEAVFPVAAV